MSQAIRIGDGGPGVAQITELLTRLELLDGARETYDDAVERAVRTFQQERGLRVDGVVGVRTWKRLEEARWRLGDRILTHLPGDLMVGDDVFTLQQRLLELGFATGRVDGYFGTATEGALKEFQHNIGLPPDGTCGPATLKALNRLSPLVRGGEPNAMRAAERIVDAGPQLSGKIVVIDPDLGDLPAAHADEAAAILRDLAARIEGRLVAIGVQAFLTGRSIEAFPGEEERATFANRTDGDLFVSLGVVSSDHPDECGASSYFFGSARHQTVSTTGERFAGLVQREVVARTDLVDLRAHAKSWELLRLTRMPAVRVDFGYLSNAGDRRRLADPGFRDTLAEAMVVAIQRFYLSPDADARTGFLRFSELRAQLAGEQA